MGGGQVDTTAGAANMQLNCAVVLLLTLVLQQVVLELQPGRERKKDERVGDGSPGDVASNLPSCVCTQSAPAIATGAGTAGAATRMQCRQPAHCPVDALALARDAHATHQEVLLQAVAPAAACLVGQRGVKVHVAAGQKEGASKPQFVGSK